MGLPGTRDPQIKERLTALVKLYQDTQERGGAILANLPGLNAARDAQTAIVGDSEAAAQGPRGGAGPARAASRGLGGRPSLLLLSCSRCWPSPAASGSCASTSRSRASARRWRRAGASRPSRQEQEAKRVNDANQAAILRLMNELQGVAEGDLTQQATVTEDITGAIADSVNYTVEELRTLVSQVQGTVSRVAATTEQVEAELDRAAGRLVRAAARDPRHRRVGAADGRSNQQRVDPGAGNGHGRAAVAAGGRVGPRGDSRSRGCSGSRGSART